MRKLTMYAAPTSRQSSEEQKHRREEKRSEVREQIGLPGYDMSSNSVRSCHNCMGRYMVEYPKFVPATGLSVQMDVVLQSVIGSSCVGRDCSLR
jgi:hypothetical protein